MTLSSVNLGYAAQSMASWGAYNKKLTSQTKAELDKLAIPYSQDITEAQAKSLIAAYKKTQETKKNAKEDNTNGKSDLLQRAKDLAQKLGIKIDENADFQAILTKIEEIINQKALENKDNINVLEQLKSLNFELNSIQAQATGSMSYSNVNQTLMESLEMLSKYNKTFL